MNFAMKLLSLSALSFFLVGGCVSSPNITEPEIAQCVLIDGVAHCINSVTREETVIPVQLLEGYFSVSPSDYAEIKNHHDALHTRLNLCESEKK